jgi:hypothetical protein
MEIARSFLYAYVLRDLDRNSRPSVIPIPKPRINHSPIPRGQNQPSTLNPIQSTSRSFTGHANLILPLAVTKHSLSPYSSSLPHTAHYTELDCPSIHYNSLSCVMTNHPVYQFTPHPISTDDYTTNMTDADALALATKVMVRRASKTSKPSPNPESLIDATIDRVRQLLPSGPHHSRYDARDLWDYLLLLCSWYSVDQEEDSGCLES